jgi:two-component system nitrate/nitrite response regulator NarL
VSLKTRVGIVDAHPFFRLGLEQVLLQQPDIEVVGVGANTVDLQAMVETSRLDLVFLDTELKGCGIKAAANLKQKVKHPVQFVFLTASERYEDVTEALKAGASGYILKAVSPEIFLQTLRLIISGETYVTPQLAGRLLKHTPENRPVDPLSFREAQILGELESGQTNKEIGRKIGISEKTVKHYVGRVLQKLSVRNRTEAVIASRSLGSQERLLTSHIHLRSPSPTFSRL